MRRAPPNRSEPLVNGDGLPSRRFSAVLENLVEDVNGLSSPDSNTQTESYTIIPGNRVVRRTGTNVQVVYTLGTGFDLNEEIEVHNDSTSTLRIEYSGTLRHPTLGTGTRTLAAWAVARLRYVADDFWKISGEGIS
jgi:hypothetical protein